MTPAIRPAIQSDEADLFRLASAIAAKAKQAASLTHGVGSNPETARQLLRQIAEMAGEIE